MANPENTLRKLKRLELLELLLEQARENEELKNQINVLNEHIASLELKLAQREITVEKAGTLAEASFALNGVLEAAQRAADQYLENLEDLYKREEIRVTQRECAVEAYAQRRYAEVQQQCDAMVAQARQYCMSVEAEAKRNYTEPDLRLQYMGEI